MKQNGTRTGGGGGGRGIKRCRRVRRHDEAFHLTGVLVANALYTTIIFLIRLKLKPHSTE